MKPLQQWLDEYSASHRNPQNKTLHWLCVPQIVFAIFLALLCIPVGNAWVNPATVAAVLALAYYLQLSWRLSLGIALVFVPLFALMLAVKAAAGPYTLWVAAAIFVEAWIGQFIGHHYEGAKPSFFKDLQFLLIGPLWLLSFVYQRWQIPMTASAAR